MKDFPFDEVVKQANERVLHPGLGKVHQKWTCQHCKARQTMETPNTFYKSGRCEECGQITIIKKCNFVAILGRTE